GVQKRGRCYCYVTAHARAYEDEIARQLLAEVDELCDPGTRLFDAPVVHGVGLVPLASSDFRQCCNLSSPRTTLLPMGEHNVAIDYGRFHNNSSRLMAASLTTRAPMSSTPSARSRFRCSAK